MKHTMRIKTVIIILQALRHIVKVLTNIEGATTNLNKGGHLYLDTQLEKEIEHHKSRIVDE